MPLKRLSSCSLSDLSSITGELRKRVKQDEISRYKYDHLSHLFSLSSTTTSLLNLLFSKSILFLSATGIRSQATTPPTTTTNQTKVRSITPNPKVNMGIPMADATIPGEGISSGSATSNNRHFGIGRIREQGRRTGVSEPANPIISDNEDNDDDASSYNSSEGGDGRMELEQEHKISYTFVVGLPLGTIRDDVWMVLSRMRDNVLEHIESEQFDTTSLNVRNGSWAIRCDAQFNAETLQMVGEGGNPMEYVLNSLEQWLMTMLDMKVQGSNITIPWMAGIWSMNWFFVYEL